MVVYIGMVIYINMVIYIVIYIGMVIYINMVIYIGMVIYISMVLHYVSDRLQLQLDLYSLHIEVKDHKSKFNFSYNLSV